MSQCASLAWLPSLAMALGPIEGGSLIPEGLKRSDSKLAPDKDRISLMSESVVSRSTHGPFLDTQFWYAVEEDTNRTDPHRPRALVIMNGEMARQTIYGFTLDSWRVSCYPRGKQLQKNAADSQRHNLFKPMEANGFEVHLWIVTSNRCDPEFDESMKSWYAPWLKAYITVPAMNSRGELIDFTLKTLQSKNKDQAAADTPAYERVIFTRPDVVHLNPEHAELFVAKNTIVFPFKCQDETEPFLFDPWDRYMCASDIVFAMPYKFLEKASTCMGKYGCFDHQWRSTAEVRPQP
uniref:Uncharacterized protein n=1 Tax=Lotharella globosa TaxID=91324 RepID=A0A6V3J2Z3_9EUKA